MTMTQFQRTPAAYVSRQQGLPDARHERHFKAVPAGFEFRPVVEFEPRAHAGLFDRVLLKRAVAVREDHRESRLGSRAATLAPMTRRCMRRSAGGPSVSGP